MTRRSSAALLAATLWFTARSLPAQGRPVRVFVSNGVKTVIDEVRPQAESAIGHPLALEFGTTATLKQRIEAGESFDAALLTTDAIADLVKDGKLASGSRADLARCGIGMGVRAGAVKPDIRTPEALKRTLQNAQSISFAEAGASRVYLEKMFDQFGIAAAMKAKTILTPSSVKSNELVRDGKAEYILTLVSEILPAPGVALVGPLPAAVQSYVSFAAGVSTKPADAAAGMAFIRFLKSPAAAPTYKAKGLDPL